MKNYTPGTIPQSTWREIHLLLMSAEASSDRYPPTFDGIEPIEIEFSKEGISITGKSSFLCGDGRTMTYNSNIMFKKPRFTNLQSLTKKNIRMSVLESSEITDGIFTAVIK
ncbi:hypothetical protein P4C99_15025 [Pontiellaceae bacterium B1224]|nr:hypothetical protein [Pontiellaceae bacterium B1224]